MSERASTHVEHSVDTSAGFLPAYGSRSWLDLVPCAAAAWSAGYALLASRWAMGYAGFPFDIGAGAASEPSAFADMEQLFAALLSVISLAGSIMALSLARSRAGVKWRRSRVAVGTAFAVVLTIGVPDARALAAAAYAPAFLIGRPFGWPPVPFSTVLTWPVLHQYVCLVGGFLWAAATLAFSRRARGVCGWCGRGAGTDTWTSPEKVARWGKWATAGAALIPTFYATTRLAWAAGMPLGITEEFLREGQAIGMWWAGAALAAVALAGAGLTLGLRQGWGETFPGWMPVLGGRPVPPKVAIIPAGVVASLTLAGGLDSLGEVVRFGLPDEGWGAAGPILLFPLWGLSLGAATLAYALRRRSLCRRCGRPG